MNIWVRRTLGFYAIGGSALGLSPTLTALFRDSGIPSIFIVLVIVAYGCGAVVGIQMLEGAPKHLRNNVLFWAAQIPFIQCSFLQYFYFSGTQILLTLRLEDLNLGITWSLLGSVFGLKFGYGNTPAFIGMNIFALAVSIFLWRAMHREERGD